MREVAHRAGVAMSSVSRVLSDHPDVSAAMRQRVADFASELMAQGAEVVIIGAVEAALVLDPEDFDVDLIDPTEMLARRCVAVAPRVAPQNRRSRH